MKKGIRQQIFYSSGKTKMEYYVDQHLLHGPSTFYSEEGKVLSRSRFVHGLQQGKAWTYYLDGSLYSIQRFVDGVPHGKQEYYYPNGRLKTLLFYTHGQLKKWNLG